MEINQLLEEYNSRKTKIEQRLSEFKDVRNRSEEDVFAEMAFCLLTPQSKATSCWAAIDFLKKTGNLYDGNEEDIIKHLEDVRFPNNKAKYIVLTRNLFKQNGSIKIKDRIFSTQNPADLREWLVENIKGYGYKEASHFLRNVGFENLAILDRHILKNLVRFGAIPEVPKYLNKNQYLEIERKFKEFSQRVNIPMDHLDLLFWSMEAGHIFK